MPRFRHAVASHAGRIVNPWVNGWLSPRCHFPIIAVEYPAVFNISASLTSSCGMLNSEAGLIGDGKFICVG
jgi:hypothetical protein